MEYLHGARYASRPGGTGTLRLILLGTSVLLYAASLFQNAVYTDKGDGDGFPALLMALGGWVGLFAGLLDWLANPLLAAAWASMVSSRTRHAALPLAAASLAFALSFLRHDTIMTDEGGTYSTITAYGAGYWLWIGSIFTALVGSFAAV